MNLKKNTAKPSIIKNLRAKRIVLINKTATIKSKNISKSIIFII